MKWIITGLILCFSFAVFPQNRKQFKTLSGAEKRWVFCHPFVAKKAYSISVHAREVAATMLKDTLLDGDGNGGQVDAFRHAFWMAALSRQIYWRKALKLGRAYERANKKEFKKGINTSRDLAGMEMDLYNNRVGVELGRRLRSLSEKELKAQIILAVLNGKLKIIKKDRSGNSLGVDDNLIPEEQWKGKWENQRCLVNSDYPL